METVWAASSKKGGVFRRAALRRTRFSTVGGGWLGMKNLSFTAMGVMAVVAMVFPGCGGDSGNTRPGSSASASSSSGSGGAGGSGGTGGVGGAGGAGGGMVADNGRPVTDFVSAGGVSKSAKYKMVHTLGQPTQNQAKSKSSSYRLQGGLNGANGSLP